MQKLSKYWFSQDRRKLFDIEEKKQRTSINLEKRKLDNQDWEKIVQSLKLTFTFRRKSWQLQQLTRSR